MKDWLPMTLFRRLAVFLPRMAVVGAMAVPATSASASEYHAAIINCSANPATTTPSRVPLSGESPVPVGVVGGDSAAGAGAYAGADVRGRAYAAAAQTGARVAGNSRCAAAPRAVHDDIVVQGTAAQADVKLHLAFHANIHQNWASVFDLRVGPLTSKNTASFFFTVAFGGVRSQLFVQVNRADQTAQVLLNPAFQAGDTVLVPRPRHPEDASIDPDGFIKLFFRNVLPVGDGGPNDPIVGVDITEIDELRGEMVLTARVPTNTPITLVLDENAATSADSADSVGAGGAVTEATLGLPTDGSVAFEVEPGFTVDAPSLGIVDGTTVPQIFTCPITTAGWRGRPAAWPVPFLTLGTQIYSENDMLTLLQAPVGAVRPDASLSLAQQVIAARLNEENGAAPGPMLQPTAVADALFSTFTGPLPYRVDPRTALGQQMMNLALALSRYNAGQLTAPQCVP
jgi:hypothetical protein